MLPAILTVGQMRVGRRRGKAVSYILLKLDHEGSHMILRDLINIGQNGTGMPFSHVDRDLKEDIEEDEGGGMRGTKEYGDISMTAQKL